jgi:type IV pilus assembly protein PilK
MNLALPRRAPEIADSQLSKLRSELHSRAGITIDSTPGVIGGYVAQRMDSLGLLDVASYIALFDESISARAEWLALTDLLTIKETRFFRQVEAFACMEHYLEELLDESPATGEFSFWSAGCSTGQELYSMAMVAESVISQGSPWLEWYWQRYQLSRGSAGQRGGISGGGDGEYSRALSRALS